MRLLCLRGAAAAQDHGVARLDAQRRGVDRDVGPRLVDDGHDAERHAQPLRARDRWGAGSRVRPRRRDRAVARCRARRRPCRRSRSSSSSSRSTNASASRFGARRGEVLGVLRTGSRRAAGRAPRRSSRAPRPFAHGSASRGRARRPWLRDRAVRCSRYLLADQHQLVAMDDFVVDVRDERPRLGRCATRRRDADRVPSSSRDRGRPRGWSTSTMATASPAWNWPWTPVTPTGSRLLPPSASAEAAPASTSSRPRTGFA